MAGGRIPLASVPASPYQGFVIERPDAEATARILKRFIRWCIGQGAPNNAAVSLADSLASRYQEPGRHYHHLGHIASSLGELDLHGASDELLEGAIWFHDVIYDPKVHDNEDASIQWFRRQTAGWIAEDKRDAICRLIEATDFRKPRRENALEALMVDIDLAILSSSPEMYLAYTRSIRLEYLHVPDETFCAGRAKVMAHFLSKPIYRTEGFLKREEAARTNIRRELERLTGE
jgi:predicted metal-dependent HD superfamily phosphohydrolase